MIKKILVRKEKREYIEDLKKSVMVSEGKKYYIEDISRDFHCAEGVIPKAELEKENCIIKSNKDSIVVDMGSGSGGSACFLATHVKEVHTFDINELHLEQVRKNVEYFDLKNVIVKKGDAYENIPIKNVDLVLLDLPEPWKAICSADKALKIGGLIVAYCPQITQAQVFVNELMKMNNYIQIKSVEIVERDWKIEGQIVRPRSLSNIHSGFITVVRKIN